MAGSGLAERVQDTQVARATGSGRTVKQVLENPEFRQQVERALPRSIAPDRFLRLILTECRNNPGLARCDHVSLLGAVMTAAQLGLEPDARGLAYLIPRKMKGNYRATFMIGYRGFIDLARRSGQITDIQAHVVYAADEFDFEYGLEPKLRHRPKLAADRGERVGVYAVATFKDGGHTFRVLSMAEVNDRKGRSASARSDRTSPWDTDFDAMCCKTAIRALAPWLPQTVEFAQAVALDEQVRTDLDTPLEDVRPEDEPEDADAGEPGDDDEIPEADLVGEIDSPDGLDGPPVEDGPPGEVVSDPTTDAATTAPSGLSDYEPMSVPALRALCAEREIPNHGTKAEIIQRLVAHDERPFGEAGE